MTGALLSPSCQIQSLQFGHGPSTVDDHFLTRVIINPLNGFNSATALRPWMTRFMVPEIAGIIELQFGHGPSTVDDIGEAEKEVASQYASIRPRPFDRG